VVILSAELLRRGHDVLLVCQPGSEVEARARSSGIPTWALPMAGWRLFPSALRLARRLRRERFDIVHAHGARDHLLAAIAIRLSPRMPLVRTKHNLTPVKRPLLYRHLTHHMIAVSRSAQRTLVQAGIPPERVSVIHDGIDLARFSPSAQDRSARGELGIGPEEFVAGTTGRLASRSKDVATLLRAARLVLDQAPRVRFLLVGRSDAGLEEMARDMGLGKRVLFTGFREDVPALLSAMDLYLQTSIREALSSSVLEAMAMARPVVATRVGGIPEVVSEGETGYLCEPGDANGLARAVLRLMEDGDLRLSMGSRARRRVERLFSAQGKAERVEGLYRALLEAHGGR